MAERQFAVIIVPSTSHALRAEKLLQAAGIDCKLIPVPRQLSSDCGVCLRVVRSDADRVQLLLSAASTEVLRVHNL